MIRKTFARRFPAASGYCIWRRGSALKAFMVFALLAGCSSMFASSLPGSLFINPARLAKGTVPCATGAVLSGHNNSGNDDSIAWIPDKTIDNVECFHKITSCNGQKLVFLKFINRNAYDVKISWKALYNTQFERNKEGASGSRQLLIPSAQTIGADCGENVCQECIIQPAQVTPTYVAEIQKFQFDKITVSKQ